MGIKIEYRAWWVPTGLNRHSQKKEFTGSFHTTQAAARELNKITNGCASTPDGYQTRRVVHFTEGVEIFFATVWADCDKKGAEPVPLIKKINF